MAQIHPSAVLDGDIQLADDVVIGPGCVLQGRIRIGAGTRLIGNVYIEGPLEMGTGNVVYPFSCLGFAPQHVKYDPAEPGCGVVIGDDNTFREQSTVHRAFTDAGPTRIGDRNFVMVSGHVGHDSCVGNDCVLTIGCMIGGHAVLDDNVILGAQSVVHQFTRVGRGVMFGGTMGSSLDVPPFFLVTGHNIAGSVNIVGLRRSGLPREDVDQVRWIYRTLYRQGLSIKAALEVIRERAGHPLVDEYIEFIESSKRGVILAVGRARRGAGAPQSAGGKVEISTKSAEPAATS